MTEEQIESRVQAMFDALDRRWLSEHAMTQAEYDRTAAEIDAWANQQYATIRGGRVSGGVA